MLSEASRAAVEPCEPGRVQPVRCVVNRAGSAMSDYEIFCTGWAVCGRCESVPRPGAD